MNPPQSQLSNSSRGDCTPARGLTRRDFRSPDSVSACCLEKLSSLISAVLHTDDSAFPVHPSRGRTDKEAEIQERIKEIERGGREEEGRGGRRKGGRGRRREPRQCPCHAAVLQGVTIHKKAMFRRNQALLGDELCPLKCTH